MSDDLRLFYFYQACILLLTGSWPSKVILAVIAVLLTLAIPNFPIIIGITFLFLFFFASPIIANKPDSKITIWLTYPAFIVSVGSWIAVIFLALMKYFNI